MANNSALEGSPYKRPAVRTPTCSRLAEIAHSLSLDLDEKELREQKDAISQTLSTCYQRLYELPEPKLPVKYPRTPGHRPTEEENPLGAWYWRCDIPGASSGQLLGKTVAIKDNIPVAGVPMMNGSRILEGYIPDVDATVVTRVLDAGGRILGKAVCEDFCLSDWSFTSSPGPVLNPFDKERMVGGSSSGCAALIASGEVDMALGCDQGGSIRTPASSVGIVGLKPTFGLVPYTGILSLEYTLDHVGPMARTVYDTALLLELTGDITGLRVGVLQEGFGLPSSEVDVDEVVRSAAYRLKELGATVEEVSIPWHLDGGHLAVALCVEGMTRITYQGHGGGTSAKMFYDTNYQNALARGLKTHADAQSKNLKSVCLLGTYLQQDYHGVFYGKAQNLAPELAHAYDVALASYHVLVMPTITTKPPRFPDTNMTASEYVQRTFVPDGNMPSFDVSGHPALTINAGFSDGLPVGMMIVGRKFDEAMVLNVAYAWEKLRDRSK